MYRAILLEPEQEGNVGSVARLVENFSIDEFMLVNPECSIGEEAEKYASHAVDRLRSARTVRELDRAVEDLDYLIGTTGIRPSDNNVLRRGVRPEEMVENLPRDADLGVMFGREGKGLSNEELDRCDFVVSIPTSDEYPVMNLSQAAAVIFYEIYTSNESGRDPSARKRREVLENLFKDVTGRLDWNVSRKEKTVRAFRNVLGRAYTSERELQLLLGAFRELTGESDN
ncbi:MAG: RNA methyltransferase [Candidatus Nanohaloarchaea archaeon]